MHEKSWRQGKQVSKLIWFFHFFFKFPLFGRVISFRSFFIWTNIFSYKKKTHFFIIFNTVYIFFNNNYLFQTCQFCQFSFNTQKHFFNFSIFQFFQFLQENEYDTHFFNFSFFFIQNKTLSYYEKGTKWKTIFCIFSEIQNSFFCFDKSQFFKS